METITINIKALTDFFIGFMLTLNIISLVGMIGSVTDGYKKIFNNLRRKK